MNVSWMLSDGVLVFILIFFLKGLSSSRCVAIYCIFFYISLLQPSLIIVFFLSKSSFLIILYHFFLSTKAQDISEMT